MARLLAARVGQAIVIIGIVATLTFVLLHLAPGDPTSRLAEAPRVPPAVREQLRRNFGLDKPLPVQYLRYVANVARGRFGYSHAEHRPAAATIAARIPQTLLLAAVALVLAFGTGIVVGVYQGTVAGSPSDRALSLATLAVYATPVFWLALMLQLVLAETLGWFPVSGAIDPVSYPYLPPLAKLWDRAIHVPLPAFALGLVGAAAVARYQRAAMFSAMVAEFVRAARAKGLAERTVIVRHALRNALLSAITLFGLAFPSLVSGAVLVETVFGWPGMGRLAVSSIAARDYDVVTGIAIVGAAMVVTGNLLADLLYRAIDPRTRTAAAR
ncbi:MAG TPA: ABC transporter permease [Gemmatimonadales bacterium]